ncbi:MAG TPA: hypothetical protein VFO38_00705 [Candidatus Saccharimonadales bacterium]|nr:hypothetical protein [Candidatus Saccharimonadales bacterium]
MASSQDNPAELFHPLYLHLAGTTDRLLRKMQQVDPASLPEGAEVVEDSDSVWVGHDGPRLVMGTVHVKLPLGSDECVVFFRHETRMCGVYGPMFSWDTNEALGAFKLYFGEDAVELIEDPVFVRFIVRF